MLAGARSRFHTVRLLTDVTFAARFWLGAFFVSQLIWMVCLCLPRPQEYVVLVDGTGNGDRIPLTRFRAARSVHAQQARLATKAFLDRTPGGWDDPDVVEIMFLSRAFDQARAQLDGEADERAAKQLHQKAEIASVQFLTTADEEVLVQVKGQLVRAGLFQNRPFGETIPFQLSLKLLRNPDLALNGRFPMAVADFRYETQ